MTSNKQLSIRKKNAPDEFSTAKCKALWPSRSTIRGSLNAMLFPIKCCQRFSLAEMWYSKSTAKLQTVSAMKSAAGKHYSHWVDGQLRTVNLVKLSGTKLNVSRGVGCQIQWRTSIQFWTLKPKTADELIVWLFEVGEIPSWFIRVKARNEWPTPTNCDSVQWSWNTAQDCCNEKTAISTSRETLLWYILKPA